jgi:N1-aminopropylagmatine ureohydrolase
VDLLRAVSERSRIVGFDVVELAPIANLVASDFLAARLVYRLIGLALARVPAGAAGGTAARPSRA